MLEFNLRKNREAGGGTQAMRHFKSLVAIVAGSVLIQAVDVAAQPAPTTKATPGKPGAAAPDAPKPPIDITADTQEVIKSERRIIYAGNVEAIQGQDRMRTPHLEIFYKQKDPTKGPQKAPAPGTEDPQFGKVERMEADGPVYYTTVNQEDAKGDHGTYLAADDTITLTGNVVLIQEKNVSTGDRLVIIKSTGKSTLYSNSPTRRVRGVLYQQDKPAPAPAGAAPTAASKAAGTASQGG